MTWVQTGIVSHMRVGCQPTAIIKSTDACVDSTVTTLSLPFDMCFRNQKTRLCVGLERLKSRPRKAASLGLHEFSHDRQMTLGNCQEQGKIIKRR